MLVLQSQMRFLSVSGSSSVLSPFVWRYSFHPLLVFIPFTPFQKKIRVTAITYSSGPEKPVKNITIIQSVPKISVYLVIVRNEQEIKKLHCITAKIVAVNAIYIISAANNTLKQETISHVR